MFCYFANLDFDIRFSVGVLFIEARFDSNKNHPAFSFVFKKAQRNIVSEKPDGTYRALKKRLHSRYKQKQRGDIK